MQDACLQAWLADGLCGDRAGEKGWRGQGDGVMGTRLLTPHRHAEAQGSNKA